MAWRLPVLRALSAVATKPALPRAREIAKARAQLEAADRRVAAMRARGDLRWALLDRAREINADPAVCALAVELAAAGDEEAREALERADALGPDLTPNSVLFGGDRAYAGDRLELSGGIVLGRLRERLAAHRDQGATFDSAWSATVDELALTGPWREVLEVTRPAWKAAFSFEVAPRGYALR